MTAKSDPLVERWRTDSGQALATEVFRRLRDGRRLDGLPLSHYEGRVDLRGVRGPSEGNAHWRRWDDDDHTSPPTIGAIVMEGLDFSGSSLPHWRWMGTTVLNCRFDGANIDDLGTWATRVEDASFARTRGVPRCLGAWLDGRQGVFRRVDFSHADLRGKHFSMTDFIECDFSHARIHKCEWYEAGLVRCRFAGLVRENIWSDRGDRPFVPSLNQQTPKAGPNPLEDVDLSQAELRWCEFRDLDLSRVALPEDEKHLVVRGDVRKFLTRTLEEMSAAPDDRYGGYSGPIESDLHWLHPDCRVGIFNLKDLAESDGGTGAILALLRRVAAEVGATTNL